MKAEEKMKQPEPQPADERDEYDDLERQGSSLNLNGWFSPSTERPLPQVIKGEVIQTQYRKNPKRNQSDRFLVIVLAASIVGLRFPENRDAEAFEDTLERGETIGIDMRQALERLDGYVGRVKLVFVAKEEIEDNTGERTWWRIEVYANLPKQPNANGQSRKPTGRALDDADLKELDKYL